jgi:hypothetical protein
MNGTQVLENFKRNPNDPEAFEKVMMFSDFIGFWMATHEKCRNCDEEAVMYREGALCGEPQRLCCLCGHRRDGYESIHRKFVIVEKITDEESIEI